MDGVNAVDHYPEVPGAQLIVEALHAHGIRQVFGVMGDSNLQWLSLWGTLPDTKYIGARHEAGAVAMADGFAVETWTVGVSTVTRGPGIANAVNALCTAVANGRPQVVITGSTPRDEPFNLQSYDHAGLLSATGATYRRVERPEDVEKAMLGALSLAESRATVVVIDFAAEAMTGLTHRGNQGWQEADEPPSDDHVLEITLAAQAIANARRPILLCGLGGERADRREEIRELAHLSDGILATTLATRGYFEGDPRNAGVIGGLASPSAQELFDVSDAIVAIGSSLGDYTTKHGQFVKGKTLIQIDRDRGVIGRQHAVDIAIHADAADVLPTLLAELRRLESTGTRRQGRSVDTVREDLGSSHVDASDEQGIDPRTAMLAIDRWAPDDRVTVVDGGHFIEWPCKYMRAPGPGSFRTAVAGGSIGLATAQVMGMSAYRKRGGYLAVMGDGCFFMSASEIETAVRMKLPVVLVVINDQAYSAEVHMLRKLGIPDSLARFDNSADIAAVARGFGATAICISKPSDLSSLPDFEHLSGPMVIDIHVTPKVVSARSANRVHK